MPKRDKLTPQARHHFTSFDQVDQLVGASEADPDLGFMARPSRPFRRPMRPMSSAGRWVIWGVQSTG